MTIWMSLAGLAGLAVLLTACGGAVNTDVAGSTPNTSRLGLLPSGQTAFTYLTPLPTTKKAINEGPGKAFGDPASYPIQLNTEVFYALAVGDTFVIAVPTVGEVSVKVLSRVVHLGQAVSLVGEVVGQPAGRVHLSGSGTALSGAIVLDSQTWHVRSTAQGATLQNEAAAGIEELPPHTPEGYRAAQERQLREEQRPPPAITPPALTLPDFSSPTAPRTGTPTPSSTPSSVTPKSAAANTVATIDLLFISDTSYQQRMGSQNAELADLANIVTVSNDAYAQSNALVQLRMAGYQRLSVDWTNVTLQDLLSDLKLMGGSFATTWAQTVLSGADVPVAVSAFTAAKGSFCGLGTVGTFNSAGLLSTGLAGGAAIAMARGSRPGFFCEDITLSHEVGHVMGSLHDRANATGSGAFSYSYGYGVANGPNPFGDIMSYLKPRQPYFSSPGLFTCLGQACGTATDDAVRTFNQTSPAVATAMDGDIRLNGIYWDPNASGTGWTVDLSKGKVIATAFVYDDAGNPSWITGLGTPCAAKPASYCIALNEYQSGQTLTGVYRASQFKRKVTDAELTFSEGYPAALQVQLGGVSKQFQRYVFDPASAFMAKPTSPGALGAVMPATYWNAAAPGTGIFMERQGETVIATAFYYRPDGSAAWSIVAGANWSGTSATGYTLSKLAFTTYANGQSLTGNYRVPVLTNASEATTYLDLEGGKFIVYNSAGTRQNELWSRFVF